MVQAPAGTSIRVVGLYQKKSQTLQTAPARMKPSQVASHEATNALHWAMHITLYCPGGKAFEIVVDLPDFFVIVDSMFTHNISKSPCYGQYEVKLSYQFVY